MAMLSTVETGTTTSCDACPIGTYKNVSGNMPCTQCPVNTITKDAGSQHISDCHCLPGYFANTDGVNCVPCDVNTYKVQ